MGLSSIVRDHGDRVTLPSMFVGWIKVF